MKQKSVSPSSTWLTRVGVALIILSFALYGSLLLLPFLTLSAGTKTAAVPILVVLGEVVFWSGGLILGKEVVSRYRRFLDPRTWRRK